MTIAYATGTPSAAEMIDLYAACTLGDRRPLRQAGAPQAMLDAANILEMAREDDLLVGLARAWTDRVYITYLADLAVRESHQRRGIGKALIRRVRAAAPQALIVLLAAPQAHEYYGAIGFAQHRSAWILRPEMPC
jgi:predicted N-acetyltransferase YhbS